MEPRRKPSNPAVPAIADGAFDDWSGWISRLSERPNLHVKLSGISAYGPPDWTLRTLAPYVDRLLETFGPARIVWGSDSPVCTLQSSLAEWVAATHSLIAGLSDGERDAVMQDNAARLWMRSL